MVLAFLDTWVTTALLLGSIIWMIKPEGRYSLKLPEVTGGHSRFHPVLYFLQLSSKRGIDCAAASSGGARAADTGGFCHVGNEGTFSADCKPRCNASPVGVSFSSNDRRLTFPLERTFP